MSRYIFSHYTEEGYWDYWTKDRVNKLWYNGLPKDEFWEFPIGYENLYYISNLGRLWGIRRNNFMAPDIDERGRKRYTLCKNSKTKRLFASIIVLTAFNPLDNYDGLEACHNNGDCTDNRLFNLRWDTHQGNINDKIYHGTMAKGNNISKSHLDEETIIEIRRLRKENGVLLKELAKMYNITETMVSYIVRNKFWKHVK